MKTAITDSRRPRGRFAPSPTGRIHLGNVFTAVMSWLSVKSRGGSWVLRIEDLDPQRSKREYAERIEDDLRWLGLDWDEGGLENRGTYGPYSQSLRTEMYEDVLRQLDATGMVYPCRCRRADLLATQAPHRSDGRVIYGGRCLPVRLGGIAVEWPREGSALRLHVPDRVVEFDDVVCGHQVSSLREDCGDFILRRADGAWAYQLAVVADDALMGITEVVRGNDLLLSTAQQIYLFESLGYEAPEYVHLPLVCNAQGVRLSKRDMGVDMGALRGRYSREDLLGRIAAMAGIVPQARPVSPDELLVIFDRNSLSALGEKVLTV